MRREIAFLTFSQRLLSVLPENAGAARVGGDEFVVVVAPASTGGLLELADRVRDVLTLSRPRAVAISNSGSGATKFINRLN